MVVEHRRVHRRVVILYRTVVEPVEIFVLKQVARSPVGIAVSDVVCPADVGVLHVVETDFHFIVAPERNHRSMVPQTVHLHTQRLQILNKHTVHLRPHSEGAGKQHQTIN